MHNRLQFYIRGEWTDPAEPRTLDVINPSTEEPIGRVCVGTEEDVDRAVAAAHAAFGSFSRTGPQMRLDLLRAILDGYSCRYEEFVELLALEMGAPVWFSRAAQVASGAAHLAQMIEVLQRFEFTMTRGSTNVIYEPIGVCGLITPWNWPLNQIICKLAPALAAGCTMLLKPSELAPLSAMLLADVLHDAGVPPGVFNLVNGHGPTVGAAMAAHGGIDMISFTGSTRAGIAVARASACTVKRVTQELGGKSASIILADADLEKSVMNCVLGCFANSGQSCNAPSRLLVPRTCHDRCLLIAKAVAESVQVGEPFTENVFLGPVISATHFARIQELIASGLDEGATLVVGGPGRPMGLKRGYFVRPTVFGDVHNDMRIAREEIFGPILAIIPYDTEDDAIRLANDSLYGLSSYISSGSIEHARAVALRLRTGNVHLNGAGVDFAAPFGGYKHSGNGREWGEYGLREYLEVKAILGYDPVPLG